MRGRWVKKSPRMVSLTEKEEKLHPATIYSKRQNRSKVDRRKKKSRSLIMVAGGGLNDPAADQGRGATRKMDWRLRVAGVRGA